MTSEAPVRFYTELGDALAHEEAVELRHGPYTLTVSNVAEVMPITLSPEADAEDDQGTAGYLLTFGFQIRPAAIVHHFERLDELEAFMDQHDLISTMPRLWLSIFD